MLHFIKDCDKFLYLVLFFLLSLTNAAPKPSETCDETKPVCLKKVIQNYLPNFVKGIPELGVEVLDPFPIDKLDLTLAGGLRLQFRDGFSRGLRKCEVEYASALHDKLEARFLCNLTIKGKYNSSGRLLMFPINGDGDSTIKCKNIRINTVLKLKQVPRPDATYLEVVRFSTNHSYEGRIQYNLTNLFKGSPETSKIVLEFMNRNWQMVAQEFGDPIVDYGMDILLRNIKKIFSIVPMKKLFTTWEPTPKK